MTMLFGIVCVLLLLLRHCWRDVFFCVCLGSGSFCHDWASHRSVLFWSLDASFVFGPLPPRRLPHSNAAALRVGLYCRPELSIIRLKNNNIHLKLDESFVHFGKSFDFMIPTDSERRLEMQNFAFTTILCQF